MRMRTIAAGILTLGLGLGACSQAQAPAPVAGWAERLERFFEGVMAAVTDERPRGAGTAVDPDPAEVLRLPRIGPAEDARTLIQRLRDHLAEDRLAPAREVMEQLRALSATLSPELRAEAERLDAMLSAEWQSRQGPAS